MANSKFASIRGPFAILVAWCGARSGRPVSASAGNRCPARPIRRRPLVVAESVPVNHQLRILNRSRKWSPNLRPADRVVAAFCTVFIRPGRLVRSAIVFKPATLLNLHRALIHCRGRYYTPRAA